jgi:hypothetical protein
MPARSTGSFTRISGEYAQRTRQALPLRRHLQVIKPTLRITSLCSAAKSRESASPEGANLTRFRPLHPQGPWLLTILGNWLGCETNATNKNLSLYKIRGIFV